MASLEPAEKRNCPTIVRAAQLASGQPVVVVAAERSGRARLFQSVRLSVLRWYKGLGQLAAFQRQRKESEASEPGRFWRDLWGITKKGMV